MNCTENNNNNNNNNNNSNNNSKRSWWFNFCITSLLLISNHVAPAKSINQVSHLAPAEVGHHRRVKRFTLEGHRWPIFDLTYRISVYPSQLLLNKDRVDKVFELAFAKWAQVSTLNFRRKSDGDANIDIQFVRDKHNGCPKGTLDASILHLAHAFFPGPNNIKNRPIHFPDYVDWSLTTTDSNRTTIGNGKTSLLATALHEIGHSLGLAHSKVSQAKMFSLEWGRLDLHSDDVAGIRALYGRDSSLKRFYIIRGRSLVDDDLHLYDKSAANLEECATYALANQYNLTVYNRVTRKCSLKRNYEQPGWSFYSAAGSGVAVQGVAGYEAASTYFADTLSNWIKSGECDLIAKMFGQDGDDDHFICKHFNEADCCTILFRLVPNRQSESVYD